MRLSRLEPPADIASEHRVNRSRHSTMKELRRRSFRILFASDPERVAVLLIGGNQAGQWNRWYKHAIKSADRLFDEHLRRSQRR